MPAKLNYDFEEYFNLELLDGYGITETSTMVTMNWSGKQRNMGSCGLPLPGMSIRIIDSNCLDVKSGEEGELICRGPNVMIGYHKKENETDKILKNDNTNIKVIRAGNDNLFRSEIFSKTLATLIGYEIEIYNTTGAIGAARAAGLTDNNFERFGKNITSNDHVMTFKPIENKTAYINAYQNWKTELDKQIKIK